MLNNSGIMRFCVIDAGVNELAKVSDDEQKQPKKLVALQSRYSDSDNEETREQCKARMVCTHIVLLVACVMV